jgi:hypothetical protein
MPRPGSRDRFTQQPARRHLQHRNHRRSKPLLAHSRRRNRERAQHLSQTGISWVWAGLDRLLHDQGATCGIAPAIAGRTALPAGTGKQPVNADYLASANASVERAHDPDSSVQIRLHAGSDRRPHRLPAHRRALRPAPPARIRSLPLRLRSQRSRARADSALPLNGPPSALDSAAWPSSIALTDPVARDTRGVGAARQTGRTVMVSLSSGTRQVSTWADGLHRHREARAAAERLAEERG